MQRPSPRFRSEEYFIYEISEEMFYPNFGDLHGDTMLVPIRMGTNMADGNQQKHLLPRIWYKSVNLSFEEIINIKVILFLMSELFK